ncbi:hypothetical protein OO007_02520 [Cocleimonas sp. KMM 6892]|uniref:hypothetical protein n=1 Tax=unclassified Cocleimonas TaxID=2639732 RepID=UPI002DB6523B|nr:MULTISPECIES: hypothetical protein [unclassified Cocleimonas]MEB8431085.1 hypothetical protein [Cocleimonas sp. KMM 6892]MEC4714143.1 hypothetical protein [Cocleimonas sp. KMM 6895]MEC4743474.1 hypothetical protein [Cocleimonas sp. KMM 6896]
MNTKVVIASLFLTAFSSNVFAFEAKFADATWDGVKVPDGQQCQKFGGKSPTTPKLIISKIPADTSSIVLEYSDRDSEKMNNGGHGRMSYTLATAVTEVEIPSIPGHSFDIPSTFKVIEAQRSPGWDTAGAYMPPCSGGKGHAYYVTIKAITDDQVTATTTLEMGKY